MYHQGKTPLGKHHRGLTMSNSNPKLEIEVTQGFHDFLRELNSTGLYGFTIEDTLLRLAERQAQDLYASKLDATTSPNGDRVGFKK